MRSEAMDGGYGSKRNNHGEKRVVDGRLPGFVSEQ
jgi:hypothetical protein